MPVTTFQSKIASLLSTNRSEGSYLAGGAAMHFEPNSIRFSRDLDYFHDSEELVAKAFQADHETLVQNKIEVLVELQQPGYIRAVVKQGQDTTKIEWAQDSAWRFMPVVLDQKVGFKLHVVDLAINKVLALSGRDEPRDFLDVMYACDHILALPGLIWAACGKDPGYSPDSLLALLRRKGKYRPEDFSRLDLNVEVKLRELKEKWLKALENAAQVIAYLPANELGCLYHNSKTENFVVPAKARATEIVVHYGAYGGVLPRVVGSIQKNKE
jgi:hypothetical protein